MCVCVCVCVCLCPCIRRLPCRATRLWTVVCMCMRACVCKHTPAVRNIVFPEGVNMHILDSIAQMLERPCLIHKFSDVDTLMVCLYKCCHTCGVRCHRHSCPFLWLKSPWPCWVAQMYSLQLHIMLVAVAATCTACLASKVRAVKSMVVVMCETIFACN